jgi:hypothetical protein
MGDIVRRKPRWRWLVYALAAISTAAAAFWILVMFAASGMGWGGRTYLQIWLFVILFVLIPSIATFILGQMAIRAAQRAEPARAFSFAILSWLLLPIVWLTEAYVLRI